MTGLAQDDSAGIEGIRVFLEKAITTQDGRQDGTKQATRGHGKAPVSAPEAVAARQNTANRISALLVSLRPRQWTKNCAVFIGIVFAQRLFNLAGFERTVLAFVTFCLASSSIYLLNDLLDLERDREHPVKCLRPLASGRLPISWAISAIIMLTLICCALILLICVVPVPSGHDIYSPFGGANMLFALIVASYLLLMAFYSVRLKHIVLVDVFVIASGFALRIIAGAIVVPVTVSPWLIMVTCLLSLFLALSKRRHELVLLQDQAGSHRQILKEYSIPMLDQMIIIVVAATIMAYSLYTFQGPTGNHHLMITIPFVLYGIFRYLYLVHMRMEGGSPEEILLRDHHMLITVLMCTILIISVLYFLPN